MIRCDCGVVEFNGNGAQLLSELSTLIHAMMTEGLGDESLMHAVVDVACTTDEELNKLSRKAKETSDLSLFIKSVARSGRVKEMMDVVDELKKGMR